MWAVLDFTALVHHPTGLLYYVWYAYIHGSGIHVSDIVSFACLQEGHQSTVSAVLHSVTLGAATPLPASKQYSVLSRASTVCARTKESLSH